MLRNQAANSPLAIRLTEPITYLKSESWSLLLQRTGDCNISSLTPTTCHLATVRRRLSYRPRLPRSSTMGSRGWPPSNVARDIDITLDQTHSDKANRGQTGRERENGVAGR